MTRAQAPWWRRTRVRPLVLAVLLLLPALAWLSGKMRGPARCDGVSKVRPELAGRFGGASTLVVTSGAFTSGQSRAARLRPPDFSDALVVAAGAEDVRYTVREEGIQELSYQIREEYRATRTLTQIRAKVQEQRWRPLKEDFLDPGSPAFREWGTGIDGTVSPERTFHTWSGQWEDQAGNVLLYSLRYDCPLDDRVHAQYVTVSAAYWPRTVAAAAAKAAADQRRER